MADALIGTGFPFRKGDDLAHYLRILETVMKSCAGVRRPGAVLAPPQTLGSAGEATAGWR